MKISCHVEIENPQTTDLHMHTTFCDGKNTPEEMVRSAIEKGFSCIGFSGHSFVPFDPAAGMNPAAAAAYQKEIARLKDAYRGKIRILCGIEMDYESAENPAIYDYVIGSVHYLELPDGSCAAVDDTPEILKAAVDQYYGGDFYPAAEQYFRTVSDVVRKTRADIIGHFDLISKFNEKERLFDENHPRYIAAWQSALDVLLPLGKVFEINTGAMSRLWRTVPYPSRPMLDYIRSRGGRLLLSSDSHSAQNIGFAFDRYRSFL